MDVGRLSTIEGVIALILALALLTILIAITRLLRDVRRALQQLPDSSPHSPSDAQSKAGASAVTDAADSSPHTETRISTSVTTVHAADGATETAGEITATAPEHHPQPNLRARIAVVVNPTKQPSMSKFRRLINRACAELGEELPLFFETTADDPGYGQTRQAIIQGATLVIAAGGDGTVRTVASALAGTDVAMALIPSGTGNLLARNLGIPLDDPEEAAYIALTGTQRTIDVGWLRYGSSRAQAETATEDIFLVIAGVGFDATIITSTDDRLKRRIGWFAYVISGLKNITGRSVDAHLRSADGARTSCKVRTVLIGNVGKLPGGLNLLPDAVADNGRLEILCLSWKGLAGLTQIVARLMTPKNSLFRRMPSLHRMETTQLMVELEKPLPVQLDGDGRGEATHLLARVDPQALHVRTPS
ncbi:diacylglycerol/lipid kinase family protein [Devriesea agamarum]|uniref:diacylglycerol/lipid kinase family protein n=1 Tax=Devriesea agamarum TaxID=472569 RepID=UPI00071C4227|nr:diacylglycerol kinase family protein [Devriesea agamarum]